jgi:V/A-type H+-transporting ATPase subunit F
MEIAVVGSPEFVVGFRLAGVKRIYETTDKTIVQTVQKLLNSKDVGILVISSKDMERFSASLRAQLAESTTPVVIPVGTDKGDMRDKVRRAIGIDLYKGA